LAEGVIAVWPLAEIIAGKQKAGKRGDNCHKDVSEKKQAIKCLEAVNLGLTWKLTDAKIPCESWTFPSITKPPPAPISLLTLRPTQNPAPKVGGEQHS